MIRRLLAMFAGLFAGVSGSGCEGVGEEPVRIKVTAAAAESGTLRVHLQRNPEWSGTVHAFRVGPDGKPTEEVAQTDVYGRGTGSAAKETGLLVFRFRPSEGVIAPRPGEELELRIPAPDAKGWVAPDLDIVEIE